MVKKCESGTSLLTNVRNFSFPGLRSPEKNFPKFISRFMQS